MNAEQQAKLIGIVKRFAEAARACFVPVRKALTGTIGALSPLYDSGGGLHSGDAGHAVIRDKVTAVIDSGKCVSMPAP